MKKILRTPEKRMIAIAGICFALFLSGCRNTSPQEGGGENPSESVMQDKHMDDEMMEEGGTMGDGMMEDGMMEGGGMMDQEMMSEEMHRAMMSEGMGSGMIEDMQMIRKMLMNHEKIDRQVENLKNGVKTRTTSSDPEISAAIQVHVRQMHERIKEKKPIRQMDPLFREIFENANKIEMQIEDIENGVVVTETSEDPQVVKLIQQHANRAVSEFAAMGMKRAMQPTPLPEGYEKKN